MNGTQKINRLENRQDTLEATFKMYMQRMDERLEEERRRDAEFKEEMRMRQEALEAKHEADRQALEAKREADRKELEAKREADRKDMYALVDRIEKNMDTKFNDMMKHVQNLTIASMVGIGAIVVSVIVFVISNTVKN